MEQRSQHMEQRSQHMYTGFLGHADPLECISNIFEDGTGILELRNIKILGHGNMVPGTQKRFREQRNVDPGTRFLELLFLENENLDTGTGNGIFIQGISEPLSGEREMNLKPSS